MLSKRRVLLAAFALVAFAVRPVRAETEVQRATATCQAGLDAIAKDVGEAAGRPITNGQMKDYWPRHDDFTDACNRAYDLSPNDASVVLREAQYGLEITASQRNAASRLGHQQGIAIAAYGVRLARGNGDFLDLSFGCKLLRFYAKGDEYRCPESERLAAQRQTDAYYERNPSQMSEAQRQQMLQQQETEQRNEDAQRNQQGY